MSVQVGNQCISQEAAENYLYSQAAPLLTQNGIIKPEFINGQWTFQGTAVPLNLPPCSPADNFQSGVIYGTAFLLVMATAFTFDVIKKVIR